MKFFITFVSLCTTSVFYISEANDFFILVYPRIREFYSGLEWNATDYFRYRQFFGATMNICEKVKKAKIFIANRTMTPEPTNDTEFDENKYDLESQFFLKETWHSETNNIVPDIYITAKFLFNDEIITSTVILCEFGNSQKDKIYLARQKSSKHLFLFGKINENDTNTLPNLLAIAMNYLLLKEVNLGKGIENVIWAILHGKTKSNSLAMKLFEEDGVDIFQLCASILLREESDEDKRTKYKYIITIPGPQNNLRTEFSIRNIPPFNETFGKYTYPALTCQVRQKADNKLLLKFKFSIIPNITKNDPSRNRIFVKYKVLNGSEVTADEHFMLTHPWSTMRGKRVRSEEDT